jgi:hypothetical protein
MKAGDHVYVQRFHGSLPYADHGICANQRDEDDKPMNPRESYKWYVATGKRFRLVNHVCD